MVVGLTRPKQKARHVKPTCGPPVQDFQPEGLYWSARIARPPEYITNTICGLSRTLSGRTERVFEPYSGKPMHELGSALKKVSPRITASTASSNLSAHSALGTKPCAPAT
jgi:hypothetical protein